MSSLYYMQEQKNSCEELVWNEVSLFNNSIYLFQGILETKKKFDQTTGT